MLFGSFSAVVVVAGVLFWRPAADTVEDLRTSSCFARPSSDGLVALGDSITIGNSEPDGWIQGDTSWVSHATCGTELTYGYNAGDNGDTTEQMLDRVDDALGHEPRWFVVLGGTNDAVRGVPTDRTIANLSAILFAARDVEQVAIGTIPPTAMDRIDGTIGRLNAGIRRLADAHDVLLIDFHRAVVEGDDFARGLTSDGSHPNADGARRLGDEALRVLRP